MRHRKIKLYNEINDYLSSGGLVNPELMDHTKVRDLLIECRDLLVVALRAERYEFIKEDIMCGDIKLRNI